MNALSAESLLQFNYLFRGLSKSAISSIAALATRRQFSKGTVVFSQGDEPDALYGIVAGKIRISASSQSGQEVFLSYMEPGDTFGEIAVMDGLPRTATATVVEDAALIMIQRSEFLRLLRNEPVLSLQLIELLCKRLRWTSELIEESAFLDGEARLAKRLLILSTLHGRLNKANQIELSISQDDLAHFLGVSRQAVNQYLREWQRKSWVALGRNRITILDAEALQETVRTA